MKPLACSSPTAVERRKAVVAQALRDHGFKLLLLLAVSGCSAAGVVATDDPYGKLAQAEHLHDTGRIAVARRHFLEAIEIFEQQGDDLGLAKAYRSYGFLVRENGEDVILRHAPSDPTNEDGRLDRSIELFRKSLALAKANDQQGLATNLHYNIGVNQYYAGRVDEACSSFDRSLATYRQAVEINPDVVVEMPAGVKDYAEVIDQAKRQAECG